MKGKMTNFCMALLNLIIGSAVLAYCLKIPSEITELTVQEYNIVSILKILMYVVLGVTTFFNVINYFLNSRNGIRKTGYLFSIFIVSFIFIKEWPIAIFSALGALMIIVGTIKEKWMETNSITIISIIGIIALATCITIAGCLVYKNLGAYILKKENKDELAYKQDYFRYVTELTDEPNNHVFINVKKDGKYGYILEDGQVVIDYQFEYASPFVPIRMYDKNFQIALVCKDGSTWIILKNLRKVLTYRSESMDDDIESKIKELEDVYYNTLGQTDPMHYEISKIDNRYGAPRYQNDISEDYTYRYDYNDEYDVLVTQSGVGLGDSYCLAKKDDLKFKLYLECEKLDYDENYLYLYSNGTIPFYDLSSNKQGWFTKYGQKVVLKGKAQLLEIIGDNFLIRDLKNNKNTFYFINSDSEPVSETYKEFFICSSNRFIVKNSNNKYMIIDDSFNKVVEDEWDFVDTSLVAAGLLSVGTSQDPYEFNDYDYVNNMKFKIINFNDGAVVAEGIEQAYDKFYYISSDESKVYAQRYSEFKDSLKKMNYKFVGDNIYK